MEAILIFLAIVIVIAIIVFPIITMVQINSLHNKLKIYNNVFISKLNRIDQLIQNSRTEPKEKPSTDPSPSPVVKKHTPVMTEEVSYQKPAPVKPPYTKTPEDKTQNKNEPGRTILYTKPCEKNRPKTKKPVAPKPPNAMLESFLNSVREVGWEQWLGTRGVLLAGIITTLMAGGFFAKYASEHGWLGPAGRACLIAGAGLMAIIIGEFTRRKDFGIVARGLTALGFGLLYSSTFVSYQMYDIIGSKTAFALSIAITVAAMSYSVTLDEKLSAFVALLGGYMSPAMLSSGKNSYNELFTYLAILSAGAMLCANYRKWRAVNWLAFIGTAVCYCGWASKYEIWSRFYSPDIKLTIAASIWAGVFFVIFLGLPVLHEIRTSTLTKREDIALILSNSMYSLFIFAAMLSEHRKPLALVVLCMASAHLILMLIIFNRNKKDTPLQSVLFSLAIFFTTVSLPIFFDAYALTIAWAAEGVILAIIAYQYKSKISEFGSIATFILVLPIIYFKSVNHPQDFTLYINQHFVSLICSAGCLVVVQYLYRKFKEKVWVPQKILINFYYFFGITTILGLCINEWYWHCRHYIQTIDGKPDYLAIGAVPMIIIYALASCSKPLRPKTNKWLFISSIATVFAATYSVLSVDGFYSKNFTIFFNIPYMIMILATILIFAVSYITNRQNKEKQERQHYYVTAFIAIALLWIITTMQIKSYWNWKPADTAVNSRFMATMYISVFWAIYAAVLISIGFWKKLPALRYTALGLFTLTLGKVFIYDMSNLANIYRFAGSVVLGVLMLAVSFLYQYARKKGIIGTLTADPRKEIETEPEIK